MSKPIPDEVLRQIAGFGAGGVDASLPFAPQNVARELLSLREAARATVAWRDQPSMEGFFEGDECAHCGKNNAAPFEAMRSLLPEHGGGGA